MPVKIAIAEDNSFALRACINKLATEPDFKQVATAFNGDEMLGKLSQHAVDVILMDIMMPVMDGIECTRRVKQQHPQIKVIMLTTFDDDENILNAIMAGASGYLLKEESAEGVVKAVRDTIDGGAPMSAGIASKVLNLLRNPVIPKGHETTENFGLTAREIELLQQLKNGLSYEHIAANLFISPGTVRKHINNIYTKLQVNNKVSALSKASANRLI
ncbi:response regulator transcription factor [Mucilaginibacter myungsuensis]|uniref:Response regulator transcription factor n=1 Tax=Mucilaginibacter myungsuensis TaxID=649104 RepID=A0A929L0P5_9SPHI|nr:response regulator transcription factor [Mucilaginibacter myungsuensis]MBE9664097.1 response regulator transcription factor [Mucilaginibacter myungsuensis]MDN3601276.1 response regulator transcription factor [Mucilaginibacter myungsuensis]